MERQHTGKQAATDSPSAAGTGVRAPAWPNVSLMPDLPSPSTLFATAFEMAAIGMAVVDAEGLLQGVNQACCTLLGRDRSALLGTSYFDLLHPDELAQTLEAWEQPADGEPDHLRQEQRYRHQAGHFVWCLSDRVRVRDPQGTTHSYIVQLQDITERREMEARLRRKRMLIDEAQRIGEVGSFEYDPATDALLASLELLRQFDLPADRPVWRLAEFEARVVPADLARLRAGFTEAFRQQEEYLSFDYAILTQDGETRVLLHRCGIRYGEDGRPQRVVGTVQDITQRKQAEQALQERAQLKEQLEKILATVPGTVYTFLRRADGTACYPFASRGVEAIFGVPVETLAQDATAALGKVHPGDRARVHREANESARSLSPWYSEYRVTHPTRGEIWVEGHSVPEALPDGGILWYGFQHDVTARKQMETALRESEAKFSATFRFTPSALTISSVASHLYLEVNDTFLDNTGYRREEIVGHTAEELQLWVEPEKRLEFRRQLQVHGNVEAYPFLFRHKDGSVRHALISAALVTLGGEPCILAQVVDVTDRVAMEQALHAREQAFRAVAENSPDHIARYDLGCRRIYVNPALAALYNGPVEKLLGKTPTEQSLLPDAREFEQRLRDVRDSGREFQGELPYKTADGQPRWGNFRVVPEFDADNRVVSILAINRDITDTRLVRENLHRLNRALRLLSACSMVLVHARDEQQLLQDTCRLIVEVGGYRLGWVGYAQENVAKTVVPVVQYGEDDGYLDSIRISWGDNEQGRGVTGLAIRTGKPHVNNNFLNNPAMTPWRAAAAKYGYQSSIALPLRTESSAFGALNIYAEEPDAFGEEEAQLLQELADTLAFGIASLRTKAERARAEEQLTLVSFAVNQVREAAFVVDGQGRFRYVNDEACRSLLYHRQELLNMSVPDIDPDWSHEQLRALFQEQMQTNQQRVFETRHRAKDGYVFPVEIRTSPFQFGGVNYNLALVQDVSERKRIAAAQREHEQRYRQIFDNASDSLYLLDITDDGRFRYIEVNPAFEQSTGLSRDTVIGRLIDTGVSAETAQRLHEKYRQCVNAGHTVEQEMELDLPAGRRILHCTNIPIRDDKGRIYRVVGVNCDITEEKRAAMLLHAREQEFRTFVEHSPDVIARYDPRGRRLYVNPALEKMAAQPTGNLVGKTLQEQPTGNAEAIQTHQQHIERVLETATALDGELPWITPDGRRFHYHIRYVPEFDRDGRVASVLAIGRDIAALKDAERRLEQSRDLLRELAARRETAREEERKHIAREIHDELGQILTALRMDVSVLRIKFGEYNPPLVKYAQNMVGLVDKTIEVVRNVASQLRPVALDMGVVPALEWLAAEFSAHTGIPCQLRVGKGEIDLDEQRAMVVFRIVQESLTNIARHAEASRVAILLNRTGRYRLEIRDNGKGFPPLLGKRKSFGLLGIRERALMLGGEVDVFSAPGKGTRIRVLIPVQTKPTGES